MELHDLGAVLGRDPGGLVGALAIDDEDLVGPCEGAGRQRRRFSASFLTGTSTLTWAFAIGGGGLKVDCRSGVSQACSINIAWSLNSFVIRIVGMIHDWVHCSRLGGAVVRPARRASRKDATQAKEDEKRR